MDTSIIKKPSAWVPVAISLVVFAIMLIGISMFGIPIRQPDEGAGAHLFQIWLLLEILSMAFFSMRWFGREPQQTLVVLAFQVGAALMPVAIVFFLKL